jgi:glycine dehydrogenase subunit 1
LQHGIIGGYDLGRDYPALQNTMLVCCTEKRTREEIDAFADALKNI